MTDTPDIIAKKAHGQAIVDALDGVRDLIDSEASTTWWGGLPPTLEQLKGMLSLHQNLIRTTLSLPEPEA